MITSSPGDLKDTMEFIRREAIQGVPSEVPFSTYGLWKDLGDLLEVFGRSWEVLWRSLGSLGMFFGGLREPQRSPWRVQMRSFGLDFSVFVTF